MKRPTNIEDNEKIVIELLRNAIYVRSPEVNISAEGSVTATGGMHRLLYTWFDKEDYVHAIEQVKAINRYLHNDLFWFSNSDRGLVKNIERNPFEAQEICRELINGEVPLESAARIVNHLPKYAWPVERAYDINLQPLEFEASNLAIIGTQLNITTDTFRRYFEYLQGIRKEIITYFGEKVSRQELDEIIESHSALWRRWGDFFESWEEDAEYVQLKTTHDTAKEFVYFEHYLFRDEIKRIKNKKGLKFFLEEEIFRK